MQPPLLGLPFCPLMQMSLMDGSFKRAASKALPSARDRATATEHPLTRTIASAAAEQATSFVGIYDGGDSGGAPVGHCPIDPLDRRVSKGYGTAV